jgi:hypothetical protein
MHRERIKSIGISILGANSGVEGKYELGLDTIKLVNEDDVTYAPPGTYSAAILSFVPISFQLSRRKEFRDRFTK